MKRFIILLSVTIIAVATTFAGDLDEAKALAGRLSQKLSQKVEFELITATHNGNDIFSLESRGDKVVVGGNNANSMAVGLNRYLNRYCKSTVSWYGDIAVELPSTLPDVPEKEIIEALKMDYNHMKNMFYEQAPEFDEIIEFIRDLEKEINSSEDRN